jgi:rRNA-processing protein FCF1
MEVLLDTNFIISCILKRIDFITQLEEGGFKIIVPREVLQEMKDLRFRKDQTHEERIAIDAGFEMLNQKNVKKIGLGKGKVDEELIKKGKNGYYIATLDNGIKRKVPNRIIIKKAKGKIEVERA